MVIHFAGMVDIYGIFPVCLSKSVPSYILFCPLRGNLTTGLFGILCKNERKCS